MPLPLVLDSRQQVRALTVEQWREGVVLCFDKPKGWTSFDVIRFVRPSLPVRKLGHAGTLDPFATGLLVCCAGGATKEISKIQDAAKRYVATVRFGQSSPSLDPDTPTDRTMAVPEITQAGLQDLVSRRFTGSIEQMPPAYSALKVGGRRAYELARKGETPDLKPRTVHVSSIEVLSGQGSEWMLAIECGKGTYIRSLARDIAEELGTCGILTALRRTATGGFHVEDAWDPADFKRHMATSHADTHAS